MAGCRPELGCADACENPARPGSAPQYAEAMDEGATADCCCGFGMWRRTPSHRWTDHRGQHADDDHGRDQPQQTRRGGRGHRGNDLADDGAYEGLSLPDVIMPPGRNTGELLRGPSRDSMVKRSGRSLHVAVHRRARQHKHDKDRRHNDAHRSAQHPGTGQH